MALTVFICKETAEHEKRVAASPAGVKKLIALGCDVLIEKGAGEQASLPDQLFNDAGAKLIEANGQTLKKADIVLFVQPPEEDFFKRLKKSALMIGAFAPYKNADLIQKAASAEIDTFSMDLMPRITRAQGMDILSSQANLAGYKAVLDACEEFTRAFPMMMTAAGTIPPAKVFVMGAGVAGLQAIATARRLGAVVSATDVRPAAKEQVESLGASFIAVEDEEFKEAETAGGYAKEMSKSYQKKQQALINETIAKQDIVITTAQIPGKPAPKLVTESMITSMKPGSVIVDLAVESGGNCALSKAGKVVTEKGVKIIGHYNVPSRLATDASSLYAQNLVNLLKLIVDTENKRLNIDWDDEIIKAIALTRDGTVIHPQFLDKGKAEPATPKTQKSKGKPAGTKTKKASSA